MKLSIVFGTLNRLSYLPRAIDTAHSSAGYLAHEVVVVDAGSTDGSLEYLIGRSDIRLLTIPDAPGMIKTFNLGFKAAAGEYVAAFNDDAQYLGDTLELACAYLDAHPQCGQVAIPYREGDEGLHTQLMRIGSGSTRQTVLYANFSVTRRWLGDAVDWWGTYLHHYAGDSELSGNVWLAGYTVDRLECPGIVHFVAMDATRRENDAGGCTLFRQKWDRLALPTPRAQRLAARVRP